jgi:ABC-2 type transport system permease protein
MLHTLELYRRLITIRIRAQMQYRASFLADMLITTIMTGSYFVAIAFVLQRFGGLTGGWGLWEVAFLYGMVETAFGAMDMIFSGFDPSFFGNLVRMGAFDQMLLRPTGIMVQVMGAEFILRRLGRILQGGIVLTLALANLTVAWDAARVAYLPVVMASLIAFFGGLFMIGAGITFWTVESVEVINIFTYGGSEMMTYPMHIYPNPLVHFFTYILPAIFLLYYPALFILNKPDPFGRPLWASFLSPVVGFGVLLLGGLFWKFALRHYQSTGT